jgi:hypothetical protein
LVKLWLVKTPAGALPEEPVARLSAPQLCVLSVAASLTS